MGELLGCDVDGVYYGSYNVIWWKLFWMEKVDKCGRI